MPHNFTAPTLPTDHVTPPADHVTLPTSHVTEEEVNFTDTIVTGVGALDIRNDNVSYTADPGDIVSDVSAMKNGESKPAPPAEVQSVVTVGENGS